jgi:hypothetical protein
MFLVLLQLMSCYVAVELKDLFPLQLAAWWRLED